VAEVEGFEGVGRGLTDLIRLWKHVKKSKAPHVKPTCGAPGGTRVPFKCLTDYLEHERTLTEFLEDFPGVTREDAIAALEEARISLAAALK
jgi:Protein of unknown function (DUF433)